MSAAISTHAMIAVASRHSFRLQMPRLALLWYAVRAVVVSGARHASQPRDGLSSEVTMTF